MRGRQCPRYLRTPYRGHLSFEYLRLTVLPDLSFGTVEKSVSVTFIVQTNNTSEKKKKKEIRNLFTLIYFPLETVMKVNECFSILISTLTQMNRCDGK